MRINVVQNQRWGRIDDPVTRHKQIIAADGYCAPKGLWATGMIDDRGGATGDITPSTAMDAHEHDWLPRILQKLKEFDDRRSFNLAMRIGVCGIAPANGGERRLEREIGAGTQIGVPRHTEPFCSASGARVKIRR